jgi:hypothetical protein
MHLKNAPKKHAIVFTCLPLCFLLLFSIAGCSEKTPDESSKSTSKRDTIQRISKQAPASLKGSTLTVLTPEQVAILGTEDDLEESGSMDGNMASSGKDAGSVSLSTPTLTSEEFTPFPHEEMEAFVAKMTPSEQPVKNTPELDSLLKREETLMGSVTMDLEKTEVLQPIADLRDKIARLYYSLGAPTRAVEYLLSSVTLAPDHADRWELLGDWISIEPSPHTLAFLQHAYAMALRTEPDRRSALIKLASACVSAHNFESATGLFEIVLDDNDYDPDWMHVALLATSYAQTGKLKEGINFFEQLLTKHGYTQYMLALAILEHEDGDTQSSEDYLAYVASSEPEASPLKAYAVALSNSFKEAK